MQITRTSPDSSSPGPAEWFTGAVYVDPIAAPPAPARAASAWVHFTPGRPDRVAHPPLGPDHIRDRGHRALPAGGRAGGGDPARRSRLLRAGENHWHGAAPARFMSHVAIHEADESGSPVTWGRHVTDEEYAVAPAS